MAKCNFCGSSILFGGVKDGKYRFCNEACHRGGANLLAAELIPFEVVDQEARQVHQGECPKCAGPGPVDVHTAHSV